MNYSETWDEAARHDARFAIYATSDPAAFEAGGQRDAAYLARWLTPESVVLDIGCGIGRVETYLAPHCQLIHAVDVSPEMLRQAGERLTGLDNIRLHCTSATDLAFAADATVDFGFALLVMHHLEREDMFITLCELYRTLRPGGRALLQFPSLLSDVYSRLFVGNATAPRRAVSRVRPYAPEEVRCLVLMAGFQLEQFTSDVEIQVLVQKPLAASKEEIPGDAGSFELGGERIPIFSNAAVLHDYRAAVAPYRGDEALSGPAFSTRAMNVSVTLAGRGLLARVKPAIALRRAVHALPVYYVNRLGDQVGEFQTAVRQALEGLRADRSQLAERVEVADLRGQLGELRARVAALEARMGQN